jgi:hypothetical protein
MNRISHLPLKITWDSQYLVMGKGAQHNAIDDSVGGKFEFEKVIQ